MRAFSASACAASTERSLSKTVTHDDFERYLYGRLTEQRDALHDSEACSLLDEKVEQLEAALPGREAFSDYCRVLRTRANYEIRWAYWRGYLDCVSLLKRLSVL